MPRVILFTGATSALRCAHSNKTVQKYDLRVAVALRPGATSLRVGATSLRKIKLRILPCVQCLTKRRQEIFKLGACYITDDSVIGILYLNFGKIHLYDVVRI